MALCIPATLVIANTLLIRHFLLLRLHLRDLMKCEAVALDTDNKIEFLHQVSLTLTTTPSSSELTGPSNLFPKTDQYDVSKTKKIPITADT